MRRQQRARERGSRTIERGHHVSEQEDRWEEHGVTVGRAKARERRRTFGRRSPPTVTTALPSGSPAAQDFVRACSSLNLPGQQRRRSLARWASRRPPPPARPRQRRQQARPGSAPLPQVSFRFLPAFMFGRLTDDRTDLSQRRRPSESSTTPKAALLLLVDLCLCQVCPFSDSEHLGKVDADRFCYLSARPPDLLLHLIISAATRASDSKGQGTSIPSNRDGHLSCSISARCRLRCRSLHPCRIFDLLFFAFQQHTRFAPVTQGPTEEGLPEATVAVPTTSNARHPRASRLFADTSVPPVPSRSPPRLASPYAVPRARPTPGR